MTNKRAVVLSIGVPLVLALVLLLVVPAAAHHKSSHSKGKAGKGKAAAGVTEDNDTNDGGTRNNVADGGDNKHPSGKDRSVENGPGNQGNSGSDPDDDGRGPDRSNGGADKPDGPGGVDLADQDGNNGCGNDDDFEDDNEGWCGKKPKKVKSVETTPADDVASDEKPAERRCDVLDVVTDDCSGDSVQGGDTTDTCPIEGAMSLGECGRVSGVVDGATPTEVLGRRIERSPGALVDSTALAAGDDVAAGRAERSPALLAYTGSSVLRLVGLALLLVLVGIVMLRSRRRV